MAEQGCRPLERLADPAHTLAVRKFRLQPKPPDVHAVQIGMPCFRGQFVGPEDQRFTREMAQQACLSVDESLHRLPRVPGGTRFRDTFADSGYVGYQLVALIIATVAFQNDCLRALLAEGVRQQIQRLFWGLLAVTVGVKGGVEVGPVDHRPPRDMNTPHDSLR